MFKPGDYVHKKSRHRFQGYVIAVGTTKSGDEIVTVEHYPEEWVFHFRSDQLRMAKEFTQDNEHTREQLEKYGI